MFHICFYSLRFFLTWTILKPLLNLFSVLFFLLKSCLVSWLRGMWDLRFLIQPGIEPAPPALHGKGKVTESPRKSRCNCFKRWFVAFSHMHSLKWKDRIILPVKVGAHLSCLPRSYLQSRNHLLPHLLGGHEITGHFRVNDPVLFLPADYDGLLTMGRAAHFLLLTLSGQGGVWVGCNHRRNWKPKMTLLTQQSRVHGFPTVTHGSIAFEMFLWNVLAEQESWSKELERWQKNEAGLNEPQAEIAVWFPICVCGRWGGWWAGLTFQSLWKVNLCPLKHTRKCCDLLIRQEKGFPLRITLLLP